MIKNINAAVEKLDGKIREIIKKTGIQSEKTELFNFMYLNFFLSKKCATYIININPAKEEVWKLNPTIGISIHLLAFAP